MSDREYVDRIDALFNTVLEIRTDVLSQRLIDYARVHGVFNFDRYGDAVVRQYYDRVSGFLEQHQSELAFDADKVMCILESMAKRVHELEQQIDIEQEVKQWG